MTTAISRQSTITITAAARQHGLDDAARQRLSRLLRGKEIGRERPRRYTVADVERMIRYDCTRRAPLPPARDLHACEQCQRTFVAEAYLARHVAREHAS